MTVSLVHVVVAAPADAVELFETICVGSGGDATKAEQLATRAGFEVKSRRDDLLLMSLAQSNPWPVVSTSPATSAEQPFDKCRVDGVVDDEIEIVNLAEESKMEEVKVPSFASWFPPNDRLVFRTFVDPSCEDPPKPTCKFVQFVGDKSPSGREIFRGITLGTLNGKWGLQAQ